MKKGKEIVGKENVKENENKINLISSFIAGAIGSGLTNPLECITVNKQTLGSNFKISELIK